MKRLIVVFALTLFATGMWAYVPEVHSLMTGDAIDKANVEWRLHLGVTPDTRLRDQLGRVWSTDGAKDEDAIWPNETDPPFKEVFFRSLHHFYNPVDRAPLTEPFAQGFCTNDFFLALWPYMPWMGTSTMDIFTAQRADRWALGNNPNAELRNKFDLVAAHDDYFHSVIDLRSGDREERTIHLFKSIGHIVHLIQDMGQPEHTRNDQHLPLMNKEASIYENYGQEVFSVPDSYDTRFRPLLYPLVDLPRYSSYFSADGVTSSIGVGLGDYSNRNFITQDTEYDDISGKCFTFGMPSLARTERRLFSGTDERVLIDGVVKTLDVVEWVLSSPVDDAYTGTTDTDVFHAFYSSLDLETRKLGVDVYSLGPPSFETRADFLLPRAVGYSAGFIHKFFRGQVSAKWTLTSEGYDITLTNTSSERIDKDARLVLTYCPGAPYLGGDRDCDTILDATFDALQINGLNPGASVTLALPTIPSLRSGDDLRFFERRVAIRGTLGQEPDEVIGLVQPPDPRRTAFFDFNSNDAFDLIYDSRGPFSRGFSYEANTNRVTVYGIINLRNSPLATSGEVFANSDVCFSCRANWIGASTVIGFTSPVSKVKFDLANGGIKFDEVNGNPTPQARTYQITSSTAPLFFVPQSVPVSNPITVTLGPNEHRTITLPGTNLRKVAIIDVTPFIQTFMFGIDNLSFDY